MAIGTFSELTASLADWTGRSDLSSTILSDFVTMTEAVFNYGDEASEIPPLRVRQMETTATVNVTDGEGTLPDDFLEIIKVKDPADTTRNIEYAPAEWIDGNFPTGQDGTYPSFYTISGSSLVCPISVSLTYYRTIPTITTGPDATNWLLQGFPNAYLWGGLMQYSAYSRNPENVVHFRALMSNALSGLRRSDLNARAGMVTKRSASGAW